MVLDKKFVIDITSLYMKSIFRSAYKNLEKKNTIVFEEYVNIFTKKLNYFIKIHLKFKI